MDYSDIVKEQIEQAASLAKSITPATTDEAAILAARVRVHLEVAQAAAQLDAAHDARMMMVRQQMADRRSQ